MVGHWWWVMFFCFPKKRLLVITFSSVNMEEEGRPKLPTLFIVNSNNGLKTLQLQHCWRRYWWCFWCYYYRLPQQTRHHRHRQHHHRHRHPNHVHIRSQCITYRVSVLPLGGITSMDWELRFHLSLAATMVTLNRHHLLRRCMNEAHRCALIYLKCLWKNNYFKETNRSVCLFPISC